PIIDAATPRATAVGDGATPRAAHTKNKTDREAYNGCCPCGHRHSAVCLCVYVDETMRGDSVVRVKRHNSRSVVIRWSPANVTSPRQKLPEISPIFKADTVRL